MTTRGDKEPHGKSRFHTGLVISEQRDPARERADIPPGGARSWTYPVKRDDGGGSSSGSYLGPPFSVSGDEFLDGENDKTAIERPSGNVVLSFTGEHTQKVDGKGRMSIPADFRRVLESQDPDWTDGLNPRMYLLYGEHLKNELHVYTVEEFGKLVEMINALPRGSVQKKKLSHLYIGQSMKMEIDRDGRTVMPIRQREKLGLKDGELYFRGVGDHFEIWKAETFTKTVAEDMTAWLDEMPDDFDPLSLLGEG